jgi:hypothetical protein
MPSPNPTNNLRRDLKEAAALLKWSGVHLMPAAVKLSEADLKVGYTDEVKAGRIVRSA